MTLSQHASADSPTERPRGFARPHQGTLRRPDAGAGAGARARCRSGLEGFEHWRDALEIVDRCLGVLGAPSSLIRLLTRLCTYVPTQAWESGESLLVWPSNTRLGVELAMDVRSVQRLIATAERAGLVSRQLGRGFRRANRRLPDGTLAGDGGIDMAPLLTTARELERTLDTPRRSVLLSIRESIEGVQRLAAAVIEHAEAVDQLLIERGDAAPVETLRADDGLDDAIEDARNCRRLASGLARRLGNQDLSALHAAAGELGSMSVRLRERCSALGDLLERLLNDDQPATGAEIESPMGDSHAVQNDNNSTPSCLESAAGRSVLADPLRPMPEIPGLAIPTGEADRSLKREISTLAPAYATRFRTSHLIEACPAIADAVTMWGVGPEGWDDLEREPATLEIMCRHAATAAGFNGERWGVEARRWGVARAMLATAAALGKPPHLVQRSAAALLSWYFTDGLARPGVDLLATLHANRRHWRDVASQASEPTPDGQSGGLEGSPMRDRRPAARRTGASNVGPRHGRLR